MSAPARMHPDDLERLAELVADRLAARLDGAGRAPAELVTAAHVAQRFGVCAEWVRGHADELGAIRLGDGPRPRLRFDVATVAKRLAACSQSEGSQAPDPAPRRRSPLRARPASASGRPLLPVDGLDE